MRFALSLILLPLLAASAAAQESKTFKDWLIGCDNLRACRAIGHPADEGDAGSYVKVTRSGEPSATPEVSFVSYVDTPKPGSTLALAFDDTSIAGLPAKPLPLEGADDDNFLRAKLSGDAALAFLAALNKAKSLSLTVLAVDGKADPDATPGTVSLAGASAALLFMDDAQKRVGTTTALRNPGGKDASTIPPVPAAPAIAAVKMTELDPAPKVPAALAGKPAEESGCNDDDYPPIAIRITSSLMLWGICSDAAAYNFTYDFSLVENGKVRKAAFELPPALGKTDDFLTNPSLSDDGLTIGQFAKGRGVGDCGVSDSWAWDGTKFALADFASMDDCFGVSPDDWPVLYRAKTQ